MQQVRGSAATSPEDMARARAWTAGWLAAPERLPIAFTYGGARLTGIPAAWNPRVRTRRVDANLVERVYRGRDPATGLELRVECLEYLDHPVVEWTAWFRQRGAAPTPILEDMLALDGQWEGGTPVLQHCNGDFYSEEGYTPRETPLPPGARAQFAPQGGRPCDGAFPYFRLAFPEGGVTLAIGWPAQWSADFAGAEGGVRVRAGQQTTHLRLQPGESVRTPRITLLAWAGEASRGVNLWRRWYLDHVLPRPEGRPLQPLLACSCNDGGEEFTLATEENQGRFMARHAERGLDYDVWWIDAGWYPCRDEQGERHWVYTGTWEPDPERFPRGLRPVADTAAGRGARLLLWFEPERVIQGSRLDREHPEWLLRVAEQAVGAAEGQGRDPWLARNRLLDLGNPDCRRWLTEHVCRLIQDNGVGVYRQDFNFPPLRYWRENEAPDRRGMLENLHVQGYLQFWDDLLARNPGLWIDSCSSGGRRNDLETMRRSVPLHYSDYGYGLHAVKLAFQHTLYAWIPYFKEAALSWDKPGPGIPEGLDGTNDAFAYHCAFAPMLASALDIRRDDCDLDLARRMIALWRRAAPLLLHGDYHPLTPFSRDPQRWVVRQFDWPERGAGLVQGFRLHDCAQESVTVRLQGVDAGSTYAFENPETGEGLELAGGALAADGFTLRLPPRAAALWLYRVRGGDRA